MRFFVLTIVIIALSLCGSAAKAQCFTGSCRLPGRPIARIVSAPVRLIQARPIRRLIAARPLRRVLSRRPVRRLFEARPVRRVLFRRWR